MSEARRAVVTGRGILSPLGCDWPSFVAAVQAGERAPAAPFPGAVPDDPVVHHPLSDRRLLERLASGGQGEPLSALATAAIRQALGEADVPLHGGPLDDVGLVMNTIFGPSTALEPYLERLLTGGPRSARPAMFVDTLLSMPASRAGIALRLRGSTAVLGGSSPLELALDWIRSGREPTVVAGGGEFHSPKCLRHLRALAARSGAARPLPAQGAAFVVVEDAALAAERGATPLAELLGAGAASEPQEVALPWSDEPEGPAFACAMRSALNDAQLPPGAVQTIALAAGDDGTERGELAAIAAVFGGPPASVALLRPKRRLGEALGASATLCLLSALAHIDGAGPAIALVNAFEMGGAVTSLVVRVFAA